MGAMVSACFNIVHTCSYIFLPHCSPKRALNIIYIYTHGYIMVFRLEWYGSLQTMVDVGIDVEAN
jgi:hypothetical protein